MMNLNRLLYESTCDESYSGSNRYYGNGYYGGYDVDAYPELSLEEAARLLPITVMESQLSMTNDRIHTNEQLVEAVCYRGVSNANYLIEMSLQGIKSKIKGFFTKIINFIKSLASKLVTRINEIRKTGRQLYAQYNDKLSGRTYEGLTYTGYDIMELTEYNKISNVSRYESEDEIDKLIKSAMPDSVQDNNFTDIINGIVADAVTARNGNTRSTLKDDMSTSYEADSADDKAAAKKIADLNDVTSATRQLKMANTITGMNLTEEGSWKKELMKKLLNGGEKVSIAYGASGFTASNLGTILQKFNIFDDCLAGYKTLQKAMETYSRKIESIADAAESKASSGDDKNKSTVLSNINSAITAYMSYISDAVSVVTGIREQIVTYGNIVYKQAKGMFVKMMNWKPGKTENSDTSGMSDLQLDIWCSDFGF